MTLRAAAIAWAACALLLLAGCVRLPAQLQAELSAVDPVRATASDAQRDAVAVRRAAHPARIDWRSVPVETGQIVVHEAVDPTSLFVSLFAERFEPYVHAGVVVVEAGRPWVYESMGLMLPRASGRPNDRMRGGVRRVSLRSFMARKGVFALHAAPAGVDKNRLVTWLEAQRRARTPFDGYFDHEDADALYCVEFVARAFAASGGPEFARTPVSRQPSLAVALRWLQIDTDSFWLAGTLLQDQPRVAAGSRSLTAAQVEAWFAMKAELHRRFVATSRLGDLFEWRLQSIRLRPRVAAYVARGLNAALDEPTSWLTDAPRLAAANAERAFGAQAATHWTSAVR
ncbi:MAG: hypothetical protein R3E65_01745 [Steroidobacteraceae bacterium]